MVEKADSHCSAGHSQAEIHGSVHTICPHSFNSDVTGNTVTVPHVVVPPPPGSPEFVFVNGGRPLDDKIGL